MTSLIKKDFKLLGAYGIVIGVFGLFYSILGYKTKNFILSQIYFGYIIFFLTYVMLMYSINFDEKSKADIVLNSLPLKRADIVKARYISYFIYPLIFGGVLFIITKLLHTLKISEYTNGTPLGLFSLLFIVSITLVFLSFYLPVYYLGIGNAKTINQIFYLFLIMAPGLIRRLTRNIDFTRFVELLNKLDFRLITLSILGFSIILYLLSLELSKRIYKAKEF